MSTSFTSGVTRDVQPGDTPDLNDGLLSRPVNTATDIFRGQACYINASNGFVFLATTTLEGAGSVPFVPVESVENNGKAAPAPISGVTAPQRVAMTIIADSDDQTFHPGSYLRIDTGTGNLLSWDNDNTQPKYARFLGIEAALLSRSSISPFSETLTPGIVPDESVTLDDGETFVGWVQLIESTAV